MGGIHSLLAYLIHLLQLSTSVNVYVLQGVRQGRVRRPVYSWLLPTHLFNQLSGNWMEFGFVFLEVLHCQVPIDLGD